MAGRARTRKVRVGREKKRRKSYSKPTRKAIVVARGRVEGKDDLEQYTHDDKKRPYNPPVGLVTPETDREMPKTRYSYDPHLDPELQWSGKKEHTSFEVDTVSLHVHERIDPLTIIEKVKKQEDQAQMTLFPYFETPENNPPLREAIHFYKHSQNWSNRLIAGDSLLVMNSLLQKEGMGGKVQMIYIDPPYGVKYGSNFQPFVNKREVKDGSDEDLTQEPEMVKAFRDTWELGIHSYLSYLKDRLLLAYELLSETGSIFVQISDENIHLVRIIMDEVFRPQNFVSLITVRKTGAVSSPDARLNTLGTLGDYIIWYAKDINKVKYRQLYSSKLKDDKVFEQYNLAFENGRVKRLRDEELRSMNEAQLMKVFQSTSLESNGYAEKFHFPVEYKGQKFKPASTRHWSTTEEGIKSLISAGRIIATENKIRYVRYLGDFPVTPLGNIWTDLMGATNLVYVVQTNNKIVERCLLMTTDPGDLVLDPTCGSGTSAYVAEQWGRRWITCDTSRVAVTLAKQRLMTSLFDYYELAHSQEGVSSGFRYNTVPHVTLRSIANHETTQQEILYDDPRIERSKKRVSGPFTVEAVPSQRVLTLEEVDSLTQDTESRASRPDESTRMGEWIDEINVGGIRGKAGQKIEFARIELLAGTTYLHADGETRESDPKRLVVSFGSPYAPLEQKQVALAIEEAQNLVPRPKIIVFASFQFDPEAAKDIDELKWPGVTILKAQMNTDLMTADLKKKRSSNESFWLVGQPDIEVKKKGKEFIVEVNGFDYYNPKTGEIESGDKSKIAMWMLDSDYDGRSLYPRQVFFPMSGPNEGWDKLGKNLRGLIDEGLIGNFKGSVSLPFSLGSNKRIAVKIIDDRGIESLRMIGIK